MEIPQLHEWNVSACDAVKIQSLLVDQLVLTPLKHLPRRVAGVDISYSKGDKHLFAAIVVMDIQTFKILEIATCIEKTHFPYIPGLLSFREIPPLLKAFTQLKIVPEVIICDGQGIAHPRRMGIATHLGLWLNIPTIGCAKKRLIGEYCEPPSEKEGESKLFYKDQLIGTVLRSKTGVRPLFISPGHLIDHSGSIDIIKKCLTKYRLPEPTRQAHLAVNHLRLKNSSLYLSIGDLS